MAARRSPPPDSGATGSGSAARPLLGDGADGTTVAAADPRVLTNEQLIGMSDGALVREAAASSRAAEAKARARGGVLGAIQRYSGRPWVAQVLRVAIHATLLFVWQPWDVFSQFLGTPSQDSNDDDDAGAHPFPGGRLRYLTAWSILIQIIYFGAVLAHDLCPAEAEWAKDARVHLDRLFAIMFSVSCVAGVGGVAGGSIFGVLFGSGVNGLYLLHLFIFVFAVVELVMFAHPRGTNSPLELLLVMQLHLGFIAHDSVAHQLTGKWVYGWESPGTGWKFTVLLMGALLAWRSGADDVVQSASEYRRALWASQFSETAALIGLVAVVSTLYLFLVFMVSDGELHVSPAPASVVRRG